MRKKWIFTSRKWHLIKFTRIEKKKRGQPCFFLSNYCGANYVIFEKAFFFTESYMMRYSSLKHIKVHFMRGFSLLCCAKPHSIKKKFSTIAYKSKKCSQRMNCYLNFLYSAFKISNLSCKRNMENSEKKMTGCREGGVL